MVIHATDFNHSDAEDDQDNYRGHDGGKECTLDEALSATTATTNEKLSEKKKGGKKSQAARGPTALPKNRGTGFEEYYADPPMTPDEAAQEKEEIYAEDICFEERIESCINRFRSRRRLQPEHLRYFNEYLFLGGVDTSPAQFTGRDPKELKELTPAERRQVLAHDVAKSSNERFYNGDKSQWVIDFTGVVAGFLSNSLLELTDMEPDKVDMAVGVVENFLRYVLQHDVCPEYEGDVRVALQLCAGARKQWANVSQLQRQLPGSFNKAAYYTFVKRADDNTFVKRADVSEEAQQTARTTFLSSLVLLEDETLFIRHATGQHSVSRSFNCIMQISSIHRPKEQAVNIFKALCIDDASAKLNPIGSVSLVPTTIETDMAEPVLPSPFGDGDGPMTLYFDDVHLALMEVGMKLKLSVSELDTGFRFVRMVGGVYPSFYTFLPQYLMRFYKPPKENERPAPSIHTVSQDCEEEEMEE